MATSNVSVSTGGNSASSATSSNLPVTSAIEHDDIVYSSNSKPDPSPDPEKECCCKRYHIVLNFH